MTLHAERPRGPKLELETGQKVLADYHWRDQKPGFPDYVQVCVDSDGNGKYMTVIGEIEGPFAGWDEIHDLALTTGSRWFAKHP